MLHLSVAGQARFAGTVPVKTVTLLLFAHIVPDVPLQAKEIPDFSCLNLDFARVALEKPGMHLLQSRC